MVDCQHIIDRYNEMLRIAEEARAEDDRRENRWWNKWLLRVTF